MKTLLEAVNTILEDARESRTTTLDYDDDNISRIVDLINASKKEILSYGFEFNYETNYPLTKGSNGLIECPNFIDINITSDSMLTVRRNETNGSFCVYNKRDKTFYFDNYNGVVKCDVILDFDFENIPSFLVQEYITKHASFNYFRAENGYNNDAQVLEQQVQLLRLKAEAKNSINSDINSFENNYFLSRKGGRKLGIR